MFIDAEAIWYQYFVHSLWWNIIFLLVALYCVNCVKCNDDEWCIDQLWTDTCFVRFAGQKYKKLGQYKTFLQGILTWIVVQFNTVQKLFRCIIIW